MKFKFEKLYEQSIAKDLTIIFPGILTVMH